MKYSELKQKATQGEWKLDGNINGRQQIASRTKGEPYWIGQFQTVRDYSEDTCRWTNQRSLNSPPARAFRQAVGGVEGS